MQGLIKKYSLKGAAITQAISSRKELEALKGKVSDNAYKVISEDYNDPKAMGSYLPYSQIALVYTEQIADNKEGEIAWFHEQAHHFWYNISKEKQERYGNACLDYLNRKYPNTYET